MIIDKLLRFSDQQAITSSAASTDVIDLNKQRDLAPSDILKLAITVVETFTAGGAATLQVQFQGSVDNSAWTTYAESAAMALADLVAGRTLFPIDVPSMPSGAARPRYLRLNYVVATGPMTAGKVTSDLVLDRPMAHQYPAGLTITN